MNELMNLIQSFYKSLSLTYQANEGDVWGLLAILFLLSVSLLNILKKGEKEYPFAERPEVEAKKRAEAEERTEKAVEQAIERKIEIEKIEKVHVEIVKEEKLPWIKRLQKGLSRSRSEIWGKLENILHSQKTSLTKQQIEEMEEILFSADLGPQLVGDLIGELEKNVGKEFDIQDLKRFLFDFLYQKMSSIQESVDNELYQFDLQKRENTKVIMIVGVNGAGKTTTIGKLATRLTRQGAKVVVGACDTFRAAAVDQLGIWCQRAGAEMVRAKEGSDPSGVAYETLQKALSEKADYCILDTAGRIHTKTNLMEELKKSKRVLSKLDESAPHHVLLVIDAITGQNALRQAKEFHKTLDLTGLIFTKCDSSSKAGNAVSIIQELLIPIYFIGVGEEVEDLNTYNLKEYLKVLLDMDL